VVVLTCAGLAGFGVATAMADVPDQTWTGEGPAGLWTGGAWSIANNWQAGVIPQPDTPIGILTFPTLNSSRCPPGYTSCYEAYNSINDVPGVSAKGLVISLDGGTYGYELTGDSLALGSGGLTAAGTTAESGATLGLPITLAAAQNWSITGGVLVDTGGISGDYPLGVELNPGGLAVESDVEVGAVSISGSNTGDVGFNARANGIVELEAAALNGTDGNPVTVTDVALSNASGSIGALTSVGASIDATGSPNFAVGGALTLDQKSALLLYIEQRGPGSGASDSQINAKGDISLGGAEVEIEGGCADLVTGDQYTLMTAGGTITGELSDTSGTPIPNGGTYTLDCTSPLDQRPTVTLNYTQHAVTATVVYPGPFIGSPSTPATPAQTAPATPPATPLPVAPQASTPPTPTVATAGHWTVNGPTTATTTANCAGPTGSTCSISVALSVTETLRGGTLVAITAKAKARPKTSTRTIAVGKTVATLDAGHSESITVKLNPAGQKLLRSRHVLAVRLVASNGTSALSQSTITFRTNAR
jgi:hypothetical protein